MQIGVLNTSAMMKLQVLRLQTPSVPVASTMAALESLAPAPKAAAGLLGGSPSAATPLSAGQSAYAEF